MTRLDGHVTQPDGHDRREVLIVEDDDDIREIVALVLGMEGYQIVGARDGAAALEILQRGEHPQVILLDLRMPNVDGATVLRWLKSHPEWSDTPVIVLSGEPRAKEEASELGAHAFLGKPFDMEELISTVHQYVH